MESRSSLQRQLLLRQSLAALQAGATGGTSAIWSRQGSLTTAATLAPAASSSQPLPPAAGATAALAA